MAELKGAGISRDAVVVCLAVDIVKRLLVGEIYDYLFEGHVDRVRAELRDEGYRGVLDNLKLGNFAVDNNRYVGLIEDLNEIRSKYFKRVANKPSNPYLAWEKHHSVSEHR